MIKYILKILFFLLVFISCKFNIHDNKKLDKNVEEKINLIINDRKVYLANEIYQDENKKLISKYDIKGGIDFIDISASKIKFDFLTNTIFREDKDSVYFSDPYGFNDKLAKVIINKWKKLNSDPNYYFQYDKVMKDRHLSFLKMMDFYNSKDMKKYEDSLKNSLINRYLNKDIVLIKQLNDEKLFKNRKIWENQNDSILTLLPLKTPDILPSPPLPPKN